MFLKSLSYYDVTLGNKLNTLKITVQKLAILPITNIILTKMSSMLKVISNQLIVSLLNQTCIIINNIMHLTILLYYTKYIKLTTSLKTIKTIL